jgi:membrane protease subunit HflK
MDLKRIYIVAVTVVIVAIAGLVGMTSWYTVDESEQAVLLTFGKVEADISEPGLHFKLPWPIQEVEILPRETFSLQFGYEQEGVEVISGEEEDTKMITGDENIVLADLVVQWRITNPGEYLFNARNPEQMLYDATSASLRGVIGSSTIDNALTAGKAEIENDVRVLLTDLINEYNIGISVVNVKLQDVDLPNEEVRAAFTRVTDARETMNTKINEANKYSNRVTNEAKGEKDAIISRAQGDKATRVEEARGKTSVFNALNNEFEKNPDITRDRLVFETLDYVLPDAKVYIMNEDGNTVKYLPITPMEKAAKSSQGGNQ